MRKLIAILAIALAAGTACASENDSNNDVSDYPAATDVTSPTVTRSADRRTVVDTRPRNGWSATEISVGRNAYFKGYGARDDFGECGWNYIVDNYSPDELTDLDSIIEKAVKACQDLL